MSTPAQRFTDSMIMTFDMWHDGTGYDLDALRAVPENKRAELETLLIAKRPWDWRDIEALGVLNTPKAIEAVRTALTDSDPQVRRTAAAYVGPSEDKKREELLLESLKTAAIFGGLSEALAEATDFHPPAVIDALLRGTLEREGDVAVHFAALLFYLHGKAKEPFDWEHRPFFLRFNTDDSEERKAVFRELCTIIGIDGDADSHPPSPSLASERG